MYTVNLLQSENISSYYFNNVLFDENSVVTLRLYGFWFALQPTPYPVLKHDLIRFDVGRFPF